ncbi:hypothetical protein [Sporomusa malonica]|uniref:Uncharacterized protein n=1 Tax=Sporomusa malonica TaxID=112901 RepID=A0A1W2AS20_9FIRM|nr:hypothetical protein [Sporomusa malonica]SMC62998.1 hypothetical protein SAMN04488500_10649 [Sporomusa malonica]
MMKTDKHGNFQDSYIPKEELSCKFSIISDGIPEYFSIDKKLIEELGERPQGGAFLLHDML